MGRHPRKYNPFYSQMLVPNTNLQELIQILRSSALTKEELEDRMRRLTTERRDLTDEETALESKLGEFELELELGAALGQT